jgi:hypothetical protein
VADFTGTVNLNVDARGEQLFENNSLMRFAKETGYKIIHFESRFYLTDNYPYADRAINSSLHYSRGWHRAILTDFSDALTQSTGARILGLERFWSRLESTRFLRDMESLREIPKIPQPTFTFNHNMVPHPPYIFDRDGRILTNSMEWRGQHGWDPYADRDLYLGQLIYVNKKVDAAVDTILAQSATEPIIIIQGDHGPNSTAAISGNYDLPDMAIFERSGILNAYYLPEHCRSALYPTITPVNSFRLVFDQCLGTSFGLLDDKTYHKTPEGRAEFGKFDEIPKITP